MSKITLTDLANLQNENTAVNAINNNNATLEAAIDNTLSRDGSTPNQMEASLDMNSNRILNLPEPLSLEEPVRLQDVENLTGSGTINVFDTEDIFPEFYGAVGDGVTDDAPAIRLAMAAAAALPNGGTVRLGPKTYLLGSRTPGFDIFLPLLSKVSIVGSGDASILKVKDGMADASHQNFIFYALAITCNDNQFRDFKIDGNGANNGGFASRQDIMIGMDSGNSILIDNVSFVNNPGSQCIGLGVNSGLAINDATITNCRFHNNGYVINPLTTDHSSVYFIGTNAVIANNSFRQDSQDIGGTAIEVHGVNLAVTGNVVNQYNKFVNVAAVMGHTCTNVTISGNSAMFCRYGVTGFALNGNFITDCNVIGNTFRRNVEPVGSGVGFIDFGINLFNTSDNKNIRIADNVISTDGTAGTAGTDPTIVFGRGTTVIEGNTIVGGIGPGIGNNGNTLTTATTIIIKDNIIQDCGRSSTAGSRRGILISSGVTVDTVVISGNRIENIASAYMTTGIDVNVNTTYGSIPNNNLISNIGTFSSVSGTGYIVGVTNSIPYSQSGIASPYGHIQPLNSAVLVSNGSGVPSMSVTLPAVSGAAVTGVNAASLGGATFAAPGAIGGTTAGSGLFTTLGASGLISANGGQIAFPATPVPSANVNTIDDYKEGTWTPHLHFGGTEIGSYTTQIGQYTKIGNLVRVAAAIQILTMGAGTGAATVITLPYTHSGFLTSLSVFADVMVAGVGTAMIVCKVLGSGTTVFLYKMAAGTATALTHADFQVGSQIFFNGEYQVA